MATIIDTITTCGNCGKGEESSDDLKACTACKLVKYCNRECQIAHRPLHKKACKKRAAELHDEALFKEHTPEDCPICLLPLSLDVRTVFNSCCGKLICKGCIVAMDEEAGGAVGLCAFCREPTPTSEEEDLKRTKNLIAADNANGYYQLGYHYARGVMGMQQDWLKANELWLRAGELGHSEAYYNLGISYNNGNGVEVDKKKAKHYWELAAMNGDIEARYNLGCLEGNAGNHNRAMMHYIISAKAGFKPSLDNVKNLFMHGYVTKDEYANTLRAYQKIQDEMKSDQRTKASEDRPDR